LIAPGTARVSAPSSRPPCRTANARRPPASRRSTSRHLALSSAPNVITRALGASDSIEIDAGIVEVEDGDVFLLCSDGLSNEVSERAIEQALLPGNCRQASQSLLDLALERGGHDNITAIVVRAEDLYSPDVTAMHPVL